MEIESKLLYELTALRTEKSALIAADIRKNGEVRGLNRELAALREELYVAKEARDAEMLEALRLQNKLTAAEQRNSELESLLSEVTPELDDFITGKLLGRLKATLKPTESAARYQCVFDGGTCGLGGQCNECPHKELGASE